MRVTLVGMFQVSDGNERYSVAQMADLLFGAQEPYHCYAAHRMLSEDRILFKQVPARHWEQISSICRAMC